jgi:ABC-type branched-subunit amino acid transport system ATPase component/ABC-type branched-subunit amino acid transport system permease subunit
MQATRSTVRQLSIFGILVVATGLLIAGVSDHYLQLVITQALIWASVGLAWNMIGGYAGQLSFGHAAFFGIGAFAVALAYQLAGITPWLGLVLAALLGVLSALGIGAITFRLRGHFFALAMLSLSMALLYVAQWAGLQEVSLPMRKVDGWKVMQFDDARIDAMLALLLVVVAAASSMAIERSRFGLRLAAIKEDEFAARAVGVQVMRNKLAALCLSGAFTAVAGGLYAVVMLLVTPEAAFGMFTSAQALILCLFGGMGIFWGPLIGAAVLVPLAEVLTAQFGSALPGIQGVLYGVAIIATVLLAPEGIYWRVLDAWQARRSRRTASVARPAAIARTPAPQSRLPQTAGAPASGRELMQVQSLSRTFGGVAAVSDFSLSVRSGTVHALIGPNGAGKTTAFNLINGFVRPDSGRVLFDGTDVTGFAPEALCRLGVGRTFQAVRAFRRLSVHQNVMIGALAHALSAADAAARTDRMLALVGLSPTEAAMPAARLTSLQLRLMELARALACQPRLLLLDETLAGLGREDLPVIEAAIRRIAHSGITVLIIEHTMHVLTRIADRMTVMDHGAVIAEGEPQRVLESPAVIESYLGRKWLERAEHSIA